MIAGKASIFPATRLSTEEHSYRRPIIPLVRGHIKFQTCLLIEPMAAAATAIEVIQPIVSVINHTSLAHARVMKDFIIFINQTKGIEGAGKGTVQR